LRNAISIIMAILGTVLILSGAAAMWAAALTKPRAADGPEGTTPAPTRTERTIDMVSRVPGPERLIIWGVVLLALSAVASGAITIAASATAGNQ
jgi:hypothetical protein